MSQQKPPNQQLDSEARERAKVFLLAAQEALHKQLAIPESAEGEIRTDDEKKTLELAQARIELQELEKKYDEGHDLFDTRKKYAGKLFWLIVGWLSVVVAFVALAGFHAWGFLLSDAILIAFITSTTVSVLGLFIVAAKWLFPSSRSPSSNTQSLDASTQD